MAHFIEVSDGELVDIDTLLDLFEEDQGWCSSTTDGSTWDWDSGDVPIIRAAMLSRDDNKLANSTAFICQYCGAPNIIQEKKPHD